MTSWQRITVLIIVLSVVGLGFYDVLAWYKGGSEATISYELWVAATKKPVIPFAFGFLMGHLFSQFKVPFPPKE